MDGNWTIYKMKVTKSNGLSYYYETTGTFNFSDFSDGEGRYSINLSYITPSGTTVKNETGTIVLKEDAKLFDLFRNNTDGSITQMKDGALLLITNNDIEMMYLDNNESLTFVLEK